MSQIYFIADTHFGHKNIIAYENRPFASVEDMDKALIENWNKAVQPEDTVFMLGDFSFYGKEQTAAICKSLNGIKYLVQGNHDRNTPAWYRDCGFTEVFPYPIVFQEFWMLSHEPMYLNQNMPYGNIYGHVHSNPSYTDASSNSCCVSAERIQYTPISFEEVKRKMGLL